MNASEPGRQALGGEPQGLCANHPDTGAVLTCARCGDFACAACVSVASTPAQLCKRCGPSEHEALRTQYGSHERQVRAVGLLFWIAGSVGAPVSVALLIAPNERYPWVLGVVMAALSALTCAAAFQLQRFTKLGQILGTALSVISVCGNPLISGIVLWVLMSKKGRAVFTDEYRAAIAATPHLHYGISMITKVLLAILVGFGVLLVGSSLLRPG